MAIKATSAFGEKSTDYARFRPDYDGAIFDFLGKHLRNHRRIAVELGAGSGQATRRIATMFDRVVAVEPDKRLIGSAALPSNVDINVAAAEDVEFEMGSIDAVVAATSFHWLDQPVICGRIAQWLSPGGLFFPFAYDVFRLEGKAQEFFAAEYEKWKPFRDRRLDMNYDYPAILKRTDLFQTIVPYQNQTTVALSIEDATGLISTMSYAAAYGRENGGHERYFAYIAAGLAEYGQTIRMVFPVVGAVGLVD